MTHGLLPPKTLVDIANWLCYILTSKFRHPTPVLLPGKSHGWRSLVGCNPWGHEESDTTEQLPFHFSLSCIGEGNGNPLQCSCLENPRDGRAWWAAVYGVTQNWTRLKRLSSRGVASVFCQRHTARQTTTWNWSVSTLKPVCHTEKWNQLKTRTGREE